MYTSFYTHTHTTNASRWFLITVYMVRFRHTSCIAWADFRTAMTFFDFVKEPDKT